MRINTNVNAMIATNQMTKNTALSGASMEKLSTGLRITKAGDDATGLAISEKMRSQIRGMEQAERNVQDGISMVQTAEGAMEEIGNITQRMRELTVQAANETNSVDDRGKITEELKQLKSEITRISESTTFNGEKILSGNKTVTQASIGATVVSLNMETADLSGVRNFKFTLTSTATDKASLKLELLDENGQTLKDQTVTDLAQSNNTTLVNFTNLGISFKMSNIKSDFGNTLNNTTATASKDVKLDVSNKNIAIQAGANNEASNKLDIELGAMSAADLKITNEAIDNIGNQNKAAGTQAAKDFINTLDEALNTVNKSRATLGAQQNRLEYTSSNLTSSTENLSAAESRIRDVDVAKEMVKLSKLNILNQASQAMVSQAKQQPESVSQLLR